MRVVVWEGVGDGSMAPHDELTVIDVDGKAGNFRTQMAVVVQKKELGKDPEKRQY